MKNIIVLSDGTGNAAAKVWRTNVWRIFEAIDLSQPDQVAHYDDGVGTSSFKPLALLGGMFGYGLKHNVIDCYKFVCRSYQLGDRLYGFGFSRGAYTIRVVGKLILSQGLVKYNNNEVDLHRFAIAAYRAFRKETLFTVWRIEVPLRAIRDFILRTPYNFDKVIVPKIRFLGVWDTVAAYGLPIEEMTRFYSNWIFPFEILDEHLHADVTRACHALSIDDERTTFHPVLWTEVGEDTIAGASAATRYTHEERFSQVWFAGSHSNVGGGYPDDSLAQVSLKWIMDQAGKCDLRFKKGPDAEPDAQRVVKSAADKDGRLYDSRQGLGAYYRYGPRDVYALCNNAQDNILIAVPKIHHTVFERINNATHPYAPIGLPGKYAIVKHDGEIASATDAGYEVPEQALRRAQHQERIWDRVWAERLAYFGIVLASLFLVVFPFVFHRTPGAEARSRLHPISDLIRIAASWIPTDQFDFWIDGYAGAPLLFIIVIAVLMFSFWLSSRFKAAIADNMRILWRASFDNKLEQATKKTWQTRLRTNRAYLWVNYNFRSGLLPGFSAIFLIYCFSTVGSHVLFNFFDAAGFVCAESNEPQRRLALRESVSDIVFDPRQLCQSTKVLLEKNATYIVRFDSTESFRDGSIDASKGYASLDVPQRRERLLKVLLLPLRREWLRPWFRVVARIGAVGSDESFLDPDLTDRYWIDEPIHVTREGELFLFVNDAVVGVPGLFNLFYYDNSGSARVTITRSR